MTHFDLANERASVAGPGEHWSEHWSPRPVAWISRRLALLWQRFTGRGCKAMDCEAFARALVPLAAKMAKADGVAIALEAEAFEKHLDVSPSEMVNVRRLYRLAQEDAAGFEHYADRISALLENETETKLWVFECLFYIACADGILHPAEDQFLQEVGRRFSYDDATIRAIRASFVHDPSSPYTVLQVDPTASLSAIKRRYRQLVSENHPDHFIASGAPPAVLRAANIRLAAITAAYKQIVAEKSKVAS